MSEKPYRQRLAEQRVIAEANLIVAVEAYRANWEDLRERYPYLPPMRDTP